MSRVTLIEIQPRLPDGTVKTLRLVDRSPRAATYFSAQWLPYITELPGFETAIGFDGQLFGSLPSPQIGALSFALAPDIREAAGWVWRDAPVTIRQADWPIDGSNPADAAFGTAQLFTATTFSASDGVAQVELLDRGALLRVPIAPLRYGSSGIAVLDAAAAARDRQAGAVVPVAFGRVLTLPGLLVDRANNIWLFAAQPAASVQAFYDGGVPFTLGAARASLAALQAASPAAGTVDWCLNAGGLLLARPADRPVYPFTADATFGSAALGDVFTAMIGGRLGIWSGDAAALTALGLGDCGLYIDDEATVAEAIDRLLGGLGICWKVRNDGLVRAFRLAWDAPAATYAAHQRHAPIRLQTILPTARRLLGYARNNKVHSEGDIARILLATDLAYADGTLIEALKPAQSAATAGAPAGTNVAGVAATTLVSDAAIAKSNAATALGQITNIVSNAVLDKSEKPEVVRQWEAIAAEQSTFNSRAAAFGITTENTIYNDAISALATYLSGLTPFWYDSGSDTPIVRSTFIGKFNDVYYARQLLADRIALIASQRAIMITGNAVVNSEFTRGTYGFEFTTNTQAGPLLAVEGGVNLNSTYSGIKNVMWAHVQTAAANWNVAGYADPFAMRGQWIGAGTMAEQRAFGLPVKQGDNVYARSLLARHRCVTQLWLLVFDKDGNYISGEGAVWTGGRLNGAGNGDPANFDLVGGTHVITNAAAASAQLMWRMLSTNEAEPYIFMCEPGIGILPAYQTALPPYQIGRTDPLADATASQPIVQNLNPTTGAALPGFGDATTGLPYSQVVASGDARDGDVVTFPTTMPGVPRIAFLPGGNAATAGQNINIVAMGLSVTGFTMKAKGQSVGAPTVVNDTSVSAGGAGEPDLVINRSNGSAPFDGVFTFRYTVGVGELAPGEPGRITLALFVRDATGSWVEALRRNHSTSGTYDAAITPGPVAFGSGAEFGVEVVLATGDGTSLTSFDRVQYAIASVTEVSLTPAGASSIPWIALL